MDKKAKFENFLESLKGYDQNELIESVKKGFQVCFESKIADVSQIHSMVYDIHGKSEDWEEGDLYERLHEYEKYELKDIDINSIDLDEWSLDEDYVEGVAEKLKDDNFQYDPIVISHHNSIIDGLHRANALKKLGFDKIKAYVGIEK